MHTMYESTLKFIDKIFIIMITHDYTSQLNKIL